MKVFAKRFWGFDPASWPIIAFGREANRDALIRESRPGDLIVFIGTQNHPTLPEDRGRLLGLAEIGRIAVDSLDVLDPAAIRNEEDYDDQGRFKWPKALPILRAWRFDARPLVLEVLKQQLSYGATVRAVPLDEDDTKAVLSLAKTETAVPNVPILQRLRSLNEALGLAKPTTGPAPTSWNGTVTRDANGEASTYVFQFGKRNIWKIGHAQDVQARLSDVNRHIPTEALGEQWMIVLHQRWPSEAAAYRMEQDVLARLSCHRTSGERVQCERQQIEAAWVQSMTLTRTNSAEPHPSAGQALR